MLNKKLISSLVIILLGIPSLALAQKQEIKDYTVKQGDTLWDISKKELNDPFLWPKVWKENSDIANPDKLTPGQTIRIPLYLIQKEVQKETVDSEPVVEAEPKKAAQAPVANPAPAKIKPLVEANLFAWSGYITGAVTQLGHVAGSPSTKNLSGKDDFIYVTTKAPAKLGDKFYIVRIREILHPVNSSRMGNLVEVLGVAEVAIIKQGETVAKILKSYEEIITGNLLISYAEMSVPVVPKPYRTPKTEGYIIASRERKGYSGMPEIVYIDKGKNAGLEVGDILRAISVRKQLEGFTKTEHKYPHGVIQLIKVYDTTSVAIIRTGIDAVELGDHVIQYD